MTRREAILGRQLFEVFPDNPEDADATGVRNLRASLERVLTTGAADAMAVQKYDIRRPAHEGGGFEERYWSPVNSPVFNGGTAVKYIIHRVEDVTDFVKLRQQEAEQSRTHAVLRDRAERMEAEIFRRAQQVQEANGQLRLANEELAKHNRDRAELNERLRELDKLKTSFFANVSHDLRTPLTLILGPIQRLLDAADLPRVHRDQLEMVARNGRTLLKHVNELLDVARLDEGKLGVRYHRIDVAQLVRETADHFEPVADQKMISYEVSVPPMLEADVDPDKLQRIVINLLSNAFTVTPAGGTIRCELLAPPSANDPSITLRVSDSGPGISEQHREKIFDRFYQVEGASKGAGSGLGLAIVREFVELHRGHVRVEEPLGGGATLVARLPRRAGGDTPVVVGGASKTLPVDVVQTIVGELDTREASTRHDSPPSSVDERATILVVEDNADMNRFLSDVLADNYRVVGVPNAETALTVAQEIRPDLIISDLMMPGIGGEAFIRVVRTRADLAEVPLLVLTARADDETRVRLLRTGAQDYLTKPIVLEELKARVANLIAIKRGCDILKEGLAEAERDLESLAKAQIARQRDLDRAREVAERGNRAKDEFLSIVSHELRTPLNVIQGWMWQVRRPGATEQVKQRALEIIERNIMVQARLVEDILDASRAAIGKLHVRKRLVDLVQTCHACVDGIEREAHAKGLTLTCDAPETPLFVWGDVDRIQQAIANLLSNAMKFTPSGGAIHLGAGREGTHARVIVEDSGVGVSPDFLPSMFDPFTQADKSTTRQFGGLGLGLAIVKQILTLHGGTVTASSDGQHGTSVVLDFPVPAVLEQPDERVRRCEIGEAGTQGLDGVKVLVVDDDADACEAVRLVLQQHGATVETVTSAAAALNVLPQLKPDVLVADLAMPEVDGYELIREVRKRVAGMDLPAVALTAYTGAARDAALGAGFQQFTSKPIPPSELVMLVEHLSDRRG